MYETKFFIIVFCITESEPIIMYIIHNIFMLQNQGRQTPDAMHKMKKLSWILDNKINSKIFHLKIFSYSFK